jgi:two-component system OmpR family response regulator
MQAVGTHAVAERAGRCRVLIVEDHAVSSHTLRKLLASEGHEVAVAATLEEAEARLPWAGCVVLDLHLPDGNGIDLLRRVREQGLPVRVAVTTGSAGEELLAAVRALRPDAIFIKPFHPPELFKWLAAA